MKKVLLVAVAGLFVLASCKKEYTCECTVDNGTTKTSASTTIKDKKDAAQKTCESGSSTLGSIKTTCVIK